MHSFPIKQKFTFMLLTLLLVVGGIDVVKGQCLGYDRVYANTQTNSNDPTILIGNSDVKNPLNAITGNLSNYSSINIPLLGGTRYQQVNFPETFNSEPIHIKMSTDITLSVLGTTIKAQAYNSLGATVGASIDLSTGGLANLLAGTNVADVIIPYPGAPYNSIRITVSSLLTVGSVNLYEAYVNKEATSNINCNTIEDIITGATSGLLGGINGVVNPNNAKDGNPTSYAEINKNVSVSGYVYLTALFSSPSVAGDSATVILSVPGTGLLDANIFADIKIVAYNGNDIVGTIPTTSTLLGLRLLDPTTKIYQVSFAVNSSFDRISIQDGGLVGALSKVLVYEIKRTLPNPPTLIDNTPLTSKAICYGENTELSIANTQSCTIYEWYDKSSGGSLLFTGSLFERKDLTPNTYTYYVQAVRERCNTTISERVPVTIIVNPLPTISLENIPTICEGSTSISLPFTTVSSSNLKYDIIWNTTSLTNISGADLPTTSIQLNIPTNTPAGTYTGTFIIRNATSNCTSSYPINLIINKLPSITLETEPTACKGITNASITYSSPKESPISYSIIWSGAAITAGFLNITDATLPSSPIVLTVPTTISVTSFGGTISVKNANGCISSSIPFNVIIHPKPPAPILSIQ